MPARGWFGEAETGKSRWVAHRADKKESRADATLLFVPASSFSLFFSKAPPTRTRLSRVWSTPLPRGFKVWPAAAGEPVPFAAQPTACARCPGRRVTSHTPDIAAQLHAPGKALWLSSVQNEWSGLIAARACVYNAGVVL